MPIATPFSAAVSLSFSRWVFCALIYVLAPLGQSVYAAEAELQARLHLDAARFIDSQGLMRDAAVVRRARLGMRGDLLPSWAYRIVVDLADGDVDMQDAWLAYDSAYGTLQIGQFKVPFSLEQQTGSNNLTFMERSVANALVPGRRMGVAVSTTREHWSVTAGAFARSIGDDVVGDQPIAYAGRATLTPVRSRARTIHIGASAMREQTDDRDVVRFRARPETEVSNWRIVDTHRMARSTEVARYGVEAAWMERSMLIQGELIGASVGRHPGTSRLNGHYIQASYALGSATYRYRGPTRGFAVRGRTAWELAARYSRLDLNTEIARGGKVDMYAVTVNRRMNSNLRLMVNYVHARRRDSDPELTPHIVQARVQFAL